MANENTQQGQIDGYNHVRTTDEIMAETEAKAEANGGTLKGFVKNTQRTAAKVTRTVTNTTRSLGEASRGLSMMSGIFGEDTELGRMFADMANKTEELHNTMNETLSGDKLKDAEIDEDYVNSMEDEDVADNNEPESASTVDGEGIENENTENKDSKTDDKTVTIMSAEQQAEVKQKGSQFDYNKDLGYTEEQVAIAKTHGADPSAIDALSRNKLLKNKTGQFVMPSKTEAVKAVTDVVNNPQKVAMYGAKFIAKPFVRQGKVLPDITMEKDKNFKELSYTNADLSTLLVKDDTGLSHSMDDAFDLSAIYGDTVVDKRIGDVEDTAVADHTQGKTAAEIANDRYQKSFEGLNIGVIEENKKKALEDAFSIGMSKF